MINKLGITGWFLNCAPGPETIKFISKWDFDSIHINAGWPDQPEYIGHAEIEEKYRSMINQYRITIGMISINLIETFGFLISSDKMDKILRNTIKDAISFAHRLGVKTIYFPSFHKSQITNLSELHKTAKLLQYACDLANGFSIDIATENTLSADQNMYLMSRINRANIKILLDTLNPILFGHSLFEFIDDLFPFLANHLHIKDGINGCLGNARLGFGEANLSATLSALYNKGYSGTFVLENDYRGDKSHFIDEDLQLLSSLVEKIEAVNTLETNLCTGQNPI